MTANQNHTYTLPYGFKTIKVTNSTAVTDAASTILTAGQIADNTQDTLTFAASNKWIKLDNNTDDTIKIGHTVSTISTSASTPTLSDESNGKTFAVPTYTYDEAGHVTALATATYTMPNGYGKFTDGTTTSSAAATFDTFQINGDNWLQATVTTDNITYTHKDANAVTAANVANVTPAFGDTFTITDLVFDSKGHIYASGNGSHTVTIPKGSYTNTPASTGATGVITGLGFTDTTGAITSTSNYLGAIELGSYTAPTGGNGITTASTLASALSTLDARIYAEEQARTNAITDLTLGTVTTNTTDTTITFVSDIDESDGIVTYTTKAITAASTLVPGIVQLEDSISSTATNLAATANAVKTLSDEVVHTDATFTYEEFSIDDETDPSNPVLSSEETEKTIAELSEKISSLEELILDLKLKNNLIN